MMALLFPADVSAETFLRDVMAEQTGSLHERTCAGVIEAINLIMEAAHRAGELREMDRVTLPAKASASQINDLIGRVSGYRPQVLQIDALQTSLTDAATDALETSVAARTVTPCLTRSAERILS